MKSRAAGGTADAADSEIASGDGGIHSTGQPDKKDAASPILTARLEYASRGWWTFPAPPDGSKKSLKSEKHSGTAWGMTTDAAVIRAEFKSHRFRDQNVGIATGAVSGIFVIETDTAEHGDGIDGEASLKTWETEHGALPETLMSRSPSGSVHRFFKHPGPGTKVKSFNAIYGKGSGVDCKGDGGMVIGVPSVMPPRPAKGRKPAKAGGAYVWLNAGHPIADAPQALLDVVIERASQPDDQTITQRALAFVQQGQAVGGKRRNGEQAWAEAALRNECKILASTAEGNRNAQLNTSAFNLGQIVGGGALSESEVSGALMAAAETNGSVEDDGRPVCEATLKSGMSDGKAKPRSIPSNAVPKPSAAAPAPTTIIAPAHSEEFLALKFIDRHEADLRFVAKWGQWFRWDDSRWALEETLHAFDMARVICREEANACNKSSTAKTLASAKTVAAVERLAKADRKLAATFEQWDSDQNKLNTSEEE